MPTKPAQTKAAKQKGANTPNDNMAANNRSKPQAIPDHEIKQNSGVSASMAIQAAQKAWDLRQAANAAGDPDAREEILAKAVNKEIEAESFGKAAKYTQSGAFQGLAAGAGLGVQPGVTIGKVTGAIVGGTVSTVTGLLGGGIGSVYGAMNGPMWDLGEMASKGVRGVVGDFPNWKSTPSQKKALEKMVMQSKETQAPSQEELEKMKADAPDDMPQSWSQSANDMTSWRPSMPKKPEMPNMPNMPSMPSMSKGGAALGLGGLGASMPSWGGQNTSEAQQQEPKKPHERAGQSQNQTPTQGQLQQASPSSRQSSNQERQYPQQARKPREAPVPKQAPMPTKAPGGNGASTGTAQLSQAPKRKQVNTSESSSTAKGLSKPKAPPKSSISNNKGALKSEASQPKQASNPKAATNSSASSQLKTASKPKVASKPSVSTQPKQVSFENKENKPPAPADGARKKPRKLAPKSSNANSDQGPTVKKVPRKLEPRKVGA